MAVSTLESAGVLSRYALFMQRVCPEPTKLAAILGVSSAVVDNVPLVQVHVVVARIVIHVVVRMGECEDEKNTCNIYIIYIYIYA